MEGWISIRDICQQYLTPKETLDTRVFDENGIMHLDLRKKIINIADIVIKRSLLFIPGLKYHDIYLRGSSAGYYYNDNSDFDVKVTISNKDCHFLTKDNETLCQFMGIMKKASLLTNKFHMDGRFVDIKFDFPRTGEFMGLYSISKNEWINKPDRECLSSLDIDDIMDEYDKRFHKIKEHIFNVQQTGELSTLEGIYKLREYREDIFRNAFLSPKEFIISKLIIKRGLPRELSILINDNMKRVLSLG